MLVLVQVPIILLVGTFGFRLQLLGIIGLLILVLVPVMQGLRVEILSFRILMCIQRIVIVLVSVQVTISMVKQAITLEQAVKISLFQILRSIRKVRMAQLSVQEEPHLSMVILLYNSTKITHKSQHGAAVGSGLRGDVSGTITVTSSSRDLLDAENAYKDGTHAHPGIGRGDDGSVGSVNFETFNEVGGGGNYIEHISVEVTTVLQNIYNPLKIHHGTKANQATNFFINDMHTKSLGTGSLFDIRGKLVNDSDEDRYWALSYDKTKQDAWLRTLELAQNKTQMWQSAFWTVLLTTH